MTAEEIYINGIPLIQMKPPGELFSGSVTIANVHPERTGEVLVHARHQLARSIGASVSKRSEFFKSTDVKVAYIVQIDACVMTLKQYQDAILYAYKQGREHYRF